MATDLSAQVTHLGRSWEGTRIEDDCPCAKASCGLAISGSADCPQHSMSAAKTIRQMHLAGSCPMNRPVMTDALILLVAFLACVIGAGGVVLILTITASVAVDAYHDRLVRKAHEDRP
jgi:hypothetical protein